MTPTTPADREAVLAAAVKHVRNFYGQASLETQIRAALTFATQPAASGVVTEAMVERGLDVAHAISATNSRDYIRSILTAALATQPTKEEAK